MLAPGCGVVKTVGQTGDLIRQPLQLAHGTLRCCLGRGRSASVCRAHCARQWSLPQGRSAGARRRSAGDLDRAHDVRLLGVTRFRAELGLDLRTCDRLLRSSRSDHRPDGKRDDHREKRWGLDFRAALAPQDGARAARVQRRRVRGRLATRASTTRDPGSERIRCGYRREHGRHGSGGDAGSPALPPTPAPTRSSCTLGSAKGSSAPAVELLLATLACLSRSRKSRARSRLPAK